MPHTIQTPNCHDHWNITQHLHVMLRGKFPVLRIDPLLTMGQLKGYFTPGDHLECQIHTYYTAKADAQTVHMSDPLCFHVRCPDDGPDAATLSDCYDHLPVINFLLMFAGFPYKQGYTLIEDDPYFWNLPIGTDDYQSIQIIPK